MTGRLTALIASLAVLGGLIVTLTRPALYSEHIARTPVVAAAWVAFGVAAWLVRKVAARPAVWFILVAGIAFQVTAITAPPAHSSDMYRYMWDGQVQAASVDPYLYPPTAPALVPLRNDFLWAPPEAVAPKTIVHPYCITNAPSKEGPAYATVAGLRADQPGELADHLPARRRGVVHGGVPDRGR